MLDLSYGGAVNFAHQGDPVVEDAMLSALGRMHELKLHVRGALNNGVTREEIAEVLLQSGVYAGVPAAVEAFRNAKEVLDEIDKTK